MACQAWFIFRKNKRKKSYVTTCLLTTYVVVALIYVGVIPWLFFLVKNLLWIDVWFGKDQRTNTIKTYVFKMDWTLSSNCINYSTLNSERNWEDLWIQLNYLQTSICNNCSKIRESDFEFEFCWSMLHCRFANATCVLVCNQLVEFGEHENKLNSTHIHCYGHLQLHIQYWPLLRIRKYVPPPSPTPFLPSHLNIYRFDVHAYRRLRAASALSCRIIIRIKKTMDGG